MLKYLLWDHDGVLVDTERWYFTATMECLSALGVSLDQDTYLHFMAQGRSCWHLAAEGGIAESTISEARRERNRLYQEYLVTKPIEIDGVLAVLAELRSKYRMAIVSTSKRDDFNLIHKTTIIPTFFEFVINREDCKHAKPDPDPYIRALERFGARPSEALAIEDSSRGLSAAVAAGLPCVIIRNSFTATQDFAAAWRVLDSIWGLPTAVGEFTG
jgi:HAD superfamily hydrolase (TIGR01509 family)